MNIRIQGHEAHEYLLVEVRYDLPSGRYEAWVDNSEYSWKAGVVDQLDALYAMGGFRGDTVQEALDGLLANVQALSRRSSPS